MRHLYLFVGCLSLILSACNTTPVKPEPIVALSVAQIKELQNYDELVAMREKLVAGLAGKPQADYAEDFAVLAQVESQITNVKKEELSSIFASKRLDEGVVAKPELTALLDGLKANTPVSADKWAPILALVETELKKTESYTNGLESKVGSEEDPLKKVALYDELAKVDGSEKWASQREMLIDGLIEQVRKASEGEEFDQETRETLALIKQFSGDDAELLDEMIGVDAKIYEKDFFNFLAEGDADSAYQTLETMSGANDFVAIKGKLAPTNG